MKNDYIPQLSAIKEVIRHTDLEYTFRMEYRGEVKPGQFFELSLPKYGEAPISVSGIGEDTVDFTIRRVGKVTNEIFENYVGDRLLIRGPYGNGFSLENYRGKELVIIAGGTGLSPVRGVVDILPATRRKRRAPPSSPGSSLRRTYFLKKILNSGKSRFPLSRP